VVSHVVIQGSQQGTGTTATEAGNGKGKICQSRNMEMVSCSKMKCPMHKFQTLSPMNFNSEVLGVPLEVILEGAV
jgi:hypothetical protein